VPWKVSDDYGVTALGGKLKLSGEQFEDSHVDMSNPFLDTAPELSLSLKKVNPREAEGKNFQDLTEHPWAGLDVELVLEASDQAGQTGTSEVREIHLAGTPVQQAACKGAGRTAPQPVHAPRRRTRCRACPAGADDLAGRTHRELRAYISAFAMLRLRCTVHAPTKTSRK
jgi:hypothetical protein